MYQSMYINSLLNFALDFQSCICKPSKQQQGVDPLLSITPAQPKVPKKIPVLPPPDTLSFASHWIQGSQNPAAAAILFTSHAKHHTPVTAHHYMSPTPPQADSFILPTGNSSNNSSDTKDDVRIGLQKLNLHSQSTQS